MLHFTEKTGNLVGTYKYFSSFVLKQLGFFSYNRNKIKKTIIPFLFQT